MKIPSKLKIGGIDYKIIQKDFHSENCCGEIDLDKNTIQIRKSLPDNQKMVTLLHEAFHAINWKLSENECEQYSIAMYQILKDNKFLK